MNLLLFVLDLILLPITVLRLILIYFFGSKYNIKNLEFIDIMMHASHKYFNQQEDNISIDTINDDIRTKINYSSRYIKTNIAISDEKVVPVIPDVSSNKLEQILPNKLEKIDNNIESESDRDDKNKLLNLIDNFTDNTTDKLKSDINKLNLKLKEVDKILEENLVQN